jgi:hypothetical protein
MALKTTFMKKLFCVVFVTCAFIMSAKVASKKSLAAVNPVAKLLVEFESNLNWSAVVDNWKKARDPWVTATSACGDAACVGKKLVELESNTKWGDVNPKWKTRRAGWVKECLAVKTNSAAAKLLVEFESYVSWDSVAEGWKKRRDGWVKECGAVK